MNGLTRRWTRCGAYGALGAVPAGAAPATVPDLVDRILQARGLTEPEAVERFCEPRLTVMHDPALLPGVTDAAERLVTAVRAGQTIAIYGDYDVDGITATAILYRVIKTVAPEANVLTYVPHRLDEGYGLNIDALQHLQDEGADLVVSVDCGISAVGPAKAARDAGLDLIITDHHHLPADDQLPDAILVHPRLPGSAYPFGDLCGAGVAFKLAWQFGVCWSGAARVSPPLRQTLVDLLSLVALGTIADVVPLVGENRVLTAYGLRLIKQTPFAGLKALIEASGLADANIDSEKVGFVLGPRLNACGRMGHAAEAVRMLTDAPADEAYTIARRLTELNRERQQTERGMVETAARLADEAGMTTPDRRAIVLADPSFHPGVVGIVCSRLVERFGRPAILLQREGAVCRGSARSISGYSIYDGLSACAEHLEKFGGHDAAAGMTLRTSELEAFTNALTAHANANITVEQLTPQLTIDCDATLHELDVPTVERIGRLSPFGFGNPKPKVRIDGAVLSGPPRQIGGGGKHLELRVHADLDGRRRAIRGVWWGGGELAGKLAAGQRLDLVIEPRLDEWRGQVSVQAVVKDVALR